MHINDEIKLERRIKNTVLSIPFFVSYWAFGFEFTVLLLLIFILFKK